MREPVTIRAAAEHEVARVLELIRGLAKYERLEHELVATEQDLREALFGSTRYAEVVFACLGSEPVGFALFFHNFSTFRGKPGIYLEDLFVLPEARGRGIGKRLLTWLARTAIERGCARLEWSVLDWNEPAIGFYRSLGAVPMDEWTTFRVADAALTALAGADEAPLTQDEAGG
jgi:GNAT superfamily N-acetyltransferase